MAWEYTSTPAHLADRKQPVLIRKVNTAIRIGRLKLHRWRGGEVIHFLHVGKTGGTALKYMFSHVRLPPKYRLVLHRHRFRLTDVPLGDRAIVFLRDPVTRFESGFWDRMRQGRPRYNVPWSPQEARAFQEFKTPNELALALSDPDLERRQRAHDAMNSIQHVAEHLDHWLKDPDYVRSRGQDIVFIGRVESLESDARALASLLGVPGSAQLPTEPVSAHRRPQSQVAELEPEAIQNLRGWYATDYQIAAACDELMADRGLR